MSHSISQRFPRRNYLPSECYYNSWIISMNEEELTTSGGVIGPLNYLRKNGATEEVMQLRESTARGMALLNECHSLFDKFECQPSSRIISNVPTNPRNDASTFQADHKINQLPLVSSRTRSNVNQSQPITLTIHDVT